LCATGYCGEANCIKDDRGYTQCVCKDGFVFDDHNKMCVDPCVGVECGPEASCVALGDIRSYRCVCNKKGHGLLEDMTCYAPVVRTSIINLWGTDQLGGRSDANFFSQQRPKQGSIVCTGMWISDGDRITVVWNATARHTYVWTAGYSRDDNYGPGNAMCKRLLFYSGDDCTGKLGFTFGRPAKKGSSSFPTTKKTMKGIAEVRSVGCEITMCENDCGSAQCVVKEGQPQCQCPEGLVFNAAKKLCLDPSLAPRRRGWWASQERVTLVGWAGGKEAQLAGSARGTSERRGMMEQPPPRLLGGEKPIWLPVGCRLRRVW
ncbi:unnamed protein product, partial [Closterium sp. Naga37s-1]